MRPLAVALAVAALLLPAVSAQCSVTGGWVISYQVYSMVREAAHAVRYGQAGSHAGVRAGPCHRAARGQAPCVELFAHPSRLPLC
jgi:hypothetical protein